MLVSCLLCRKLTLVGHVVLLMWVLKVPNTYIYICRFLRILNTKFKHVFFSIVTFDTQKWAIIILLRLRYTHLIIHQKGIVTTIEKEANLPHVGWWVVLDLWVQLTIGSFVGMQLYIVYAVCTWT